MKKLLMLNASEHEIPFILAARKLGFYVITTSTKKDYSGHKYADKYIYGDYNNYDEMIALCKKEGIDAISQGCTDDCALSAAYIGEALGLKGHDTYKNAQIIHRKDFFKEFSKINDVITPLSETFLDIESALNYCKTVKLPVIIKPTDLAGGQGIHIANTYEECCEFVRVAFESSKAKHIVIEQYIDGTLHSLNTFIVNQKVVAYCAANDYSYVNKYMTNTGVSPADNYQSAIKVLIPETERIASLLQLVDGQLHMQYMVDKKGKVWIIEMMRRNIGNNWSMMLTDSVGVNWPEWIIRAEAGMNCEAIPNTRYSNGYYGYHMMMANKNGIFKGVDISEEIKPYIYQITMWEQPGFEIKNYMYSKVGNLMFHFDNKEQKEKYIPIINELVKVVVE